MKILVIDDSNAMRMIIIRSLRQAGFASGATIIEASNGAETIEALRAHQPELVLSDWNLPDIQGASLLDVLRATPMKIGFGLITSDRSLRVRRRAAECGALFVLNKPFTPGQLELILHPIVGPFRQQQKAGQANPLPTVGAIQHVLESLLNKQVGVVTAIGSLAAGPSSVAASFVNDRGAMCFLILADILAAVGISAGFAGLPPKATDETLTRGVLHKELLEVFREVLNVLSSTMTTVGGENVSLAAVYHPPSEYLLKATRAAQGRLLLEISVAGFGTGKLLLCSTSTTEVQPSP